MPAEGTVCRQCGGPLRSVGGGASSEQAKSGEGVEPDAALTMQLQGLQHEVSRSRAAVVLAGTAAFALGTLLVGLLVGLHFYRVWQFAEVAEIDVSSATTPGEAEIRFVRQSEGKVEFIREAAGRTEMLVDHGHHDFSSQSGETQFVWSGEESGDYTIRVRTRNGWSTIEKTWQSRGGKLRRAD